MALQPRNTLRYAAPLVKVPSIWLLALAVPSVAGCVLEPVDFSNRSCPCAEDAGWRCDDATNTCVRTSDGVCGRPGADPGVVELSNLRVAWTTPNQARLGWEATNLDQLFTYEVDVAATEEALGAGDLLWTVDSEENPELARGYLPNTNELDDVLNTTLRALEPNTAYRVRLVAVDSAGGVTCSNIALARTTPEAVEGLPIAQETADGASPLPPCVTLVDSPTTAASGSAHWQYTARCEEEAADRGIPVCGEPSRAYPRCWEHVRVQGLDYDLSLTESEFQQAFLELAVEIVDTDNGFWGEIGLSTWNDERNGHDNFIEARLTLASNVGYQRYQIPLATLSGGGSTLTPEQLSRGVRGFRVGTIWRDGATVRVDDAAIRW